MCVRRRLEVSGFDGQERLVRPLWRQTVRLSGPCPTARGSCPAAERRSAEAAPLFEVLHVVWPGVIQGVRRMSHFGVALDSLDGLIAL